MRIRDLVGIVIVAWGFMAMIVVNSHPGMRSLAVAVMALHAFIAILLFRESKTEKDPKE